jgi:hypothetical protein
MNELRELISQLETSNGNEVLILQKINELFLTKLMISIKEDLVLYPTEVEVYYNHVTRFPDSCVHMNELQQNHFGKLYFHRKRKKKENAILFWNYGGIDVCISSGNYYLSILIRSARFNSEEKPIPGPCKLLWEVVDWVCNEDNIQKLSEENTATLNQLEEKVVLVETDNNDIRRVNSISVTKRTGIHKGDYVETPLRSIIDK